jgi:hypothetical protein
MKVMMMDLIERYVQEVARRLPRSQREDVARELRSSLEDSLENRAGVPLDEAGEDTATELLLEFGPPRDVAASYQSGPNYLIGPAHYPSFLRAMKIALVVVGGLIALGLLVDAAGSTGEIRELARIGAQAISDIQTGFLSVLGLVVFVFAIIERTSTPKWLSEDDWHPSDLPPAIEDADQIDRAGTIVGLVLSGIALVLINLYPEWLQIRTYSSGEQFSYPLLGSAIRAEVVILSLYLALGIVLGVVILLRNRWQVQTRFADAAISTILLLFLVRLWSKADQLLPDRGDLIEAGWPPDEASNFAELADQILSSALWWLLLAGVLVATWVAIRKAIAAIRAERDRRTA